MSNQPDQPKIIVDEDWKSQVEAEKAAARAAADSPAATSTAAVEATASTSRNPAAELPEGALPPATLTFLLTTLATQAMIALGQIPNPITGKAEVRPQQAKHYIDTLAMLEENTNAHRTPEETTLLTEILHQLRMAYVMLKNATTV
jgi:hypothetical protein